MSEAPPHPAPLAGSMVDQPKPPSKPLEMLSWTILLLTTTSFLASAIHLPLFGEIYVFYGGAAATLMMIAILVIRVAIFSKNLAIIYSSIAVIFFAGVSYMLWLQNSGIFWVSMAAFNVLFMAPLLTIGLSIRYIRNHHAKHVYILFYLFFLMTCLGFGIYFYLDYLHLMKIGFLGSIDIEKAASGDVLTSILQWYLDISEDARGEIFLVSIVGGAIIVPQILSFLISGLFGCGTSPILVSEVSKFAFLSIIKFFCVLSALIMAEQLYRFYGFPGRSSFLTILGLDWDIGRSLSLLAAAFGLSAVYYNLPSTLRSMENDDFRVISNRLWQHMTRFTEPDEEGPVDTLTIAALAGLATATVGVIGALARFVRELRNLRRPR